MKKAAIIYMSLTGNTEKVAESIHQGLTEGGVQSVLLKVEDVGEVDFYEYDLICLGTPSHSWLPPKAMDEFLRSMFNRYKKEGRVTPGAPALPGKYALIFCTYSGPHTGVREAIPAGKYVGQYFEHLGFTIADEWYVLSEFHGSEKNSTLGRMGNIKGLPSKDDLERLKTRAVNLAQRL